MSGVHLEEKRHRENHTGEEASCEDTDTQKEDGPMSRWRQRLKSGCCKGRNAKDNLKTPEVKREEVCPDNTLILDF